MQKTCKFLLKKDAVETSFAKWAQPGHFSRTLAKGPKTTTWIWNLHADAHDFDSQTSSLEEVSRKIFSAHFGQLAIIFLWISGMHFHGAYFSNYSAWLNDPVNIKTKFTSCLANCWSRSIKWRCRWEFPRCSNNFRLVPNVACRRNYKVKLNYIGLQLAV